MNSLDLQERERDGGRERGRDRHRHTQADRPKNGETKNQKQIPTDRYRHRHRHTETPTEGKSKREKYAFTHTYSSLLVSEVLITAHLHLLHAGLEGRHGDTLVAPLLSHTSAPQWVGSGWTHTSRRNHTSSTRQKQRGDERGEGGREMGSGGGGVSTTKVLVILFTANYTSSVTLDRNHRSKQMSSTGPQMQKFFQRKSHTPRTRPLNKVEER